jgi:hypothetical protein
MNLLDKLDLEKKLQIAFQKDLIHIPIANKEEYLTRLLFPFQRIPAAGTD